MRKHNVHLDAVIKGLHSFLESSARICETGETLEEVLLPPKAPKKAHAVFWEDDWWRGVELATLCADRAFAVEPDVDRGVLLTLAFNRREGRKEKPLSPQQAEVLSVLEHLLANVEKTGDPDISVYEAFDAPFRDATSGKSFYETQAEDIEEASSMWEEAASSQAPESC